MFEIVLDCVNEVAVEFLPIKLEVDHERRLVTSPSLKRAGVPLSLSSVYPPALQRKWPLGYMTSLVRLCSSRNTATQGAQKCVEQFVLARDVLA